MTTRLDPALHPAWTPTDPQRHALAQRWRLTTERLVEARHHFRRLSDAESIDIRELRRAARLLYDLELERSALGRAMEETEREDACAAHRASPALPAPDLRA